MKIGFDGKRATHNFRGLGNYSRGLLEGLTKYSSESELFLYTPEYNDPRAINWISKHPNINIIKPNSFMANNFPGFWRSFLLDSLLSHDEIDIYHGLSHEIPKLSAKRKYKAVVTIHDLIFIRFPEFFPWLDRKVYAKKFQYSVDNADLVIAICEQTKSDIINFLNVKEEKIRVHYQSASDLFYHRNSIDELNLFKKNHNLSRKFILNVGAFEDRKNQKNVVKAFSKIYEKFDFDLVLVGTGKQYLKEVKSLVTQLGLVNRVHFFNNFPFHSLPKLYQASSLFFFPSLFEGFGIPLVEALFSGTPIVTSHGSCFPESAGPQSVYIDPLNLDSMVEGISQVLSSEARSLSMIEDGYLFSKQFTQANSTQKLLELYSSLK